MRVGNGSDLSKTEAVYLPSPRAEYSVADTSRFNVLDVNGSTAGFIDFKQELHTVSPTDLSRRSNKKIHHNLAKRISFSLHNAKREELPLAMAAAAAAMVC
jgi:hypothetical protein